MSSDLPGTEGDEFQFLAHEEADTERLGCAIGAALRAGDVVALIGPLGAGKTRLVQAIAAAMGVDRREVSSPTFVLIQEYRGRLPVYHFDTYRLRDLEEFLALGADEILQSGGVCLVEWADRVLDVLPADLVRIDAAIAGPASREFTVTGPGPRGQRLVAALRRGIGRGTMEDRGRKSRD